MNVEGTFYYEIDSRFSHIHCIWIQISERDSYLCQCACFTCLLSQLCVSVCLFSKFESWNVLNRKILSTVPTYCVICWIPRFWKLTKCDHSFITSENINFEPNPQIEISRFVNIAPVTKHHVFLGPLTVLPIVSVPNHCLLH